MTNNVSEEIVRIRDRVAQLKHSGKVDCGAVTYESDVQFLLDQLVKLGNKVAAETPIKCPGCGVLCAFRYPWKMELSDARVGMSDPRKHAPVKLHVIACGFCDHLSVDSINEILEQNIKTTHISALDVARITLSRNLED